MKSVVFNNREYVDLEDIKKIFPEILKYVSKEDTKENTPISARKAVMITMEKRIELDNMPRYKLKRDSIIKQARVDFNLKNREYNRFPTLDDAHPENPCLKYEDNGRKKGSYKRSVNFICANESWLLKKQVLIKKFNFIREDLDLC